MAGVGGTGVVTASQVVATAALLDGTAVRGLDQTGLSQKAGPVVSDLCLGGGDDAAGSNHLGAGQADLLVAFDGLVAASDGPLGAAGPGRTHLVASTTVTPTASMVLHPGLHTAEPEVVERRLRAACVAPGWFVDAGAVATLLVGAPAVANMVLVGVTVQSGLLPVSPGAVGEAIGLNGVAAADNAAAFAWGRLAVAEPAVLAAALDRARSSRTTRPTAGATAAAPADRAPTAAPGVTGGAASGDAPHRTGVVAATARRLAELGVPQGAVEGYELRGADLVGYQGAALAAEHARRVLAAAERELAVAPGSWDLTEAVDSQVYRVLAYKDEYEVARLLGTPEARAAAEQVVGGPARVTWMLHPPVLRSLGVQRKLRVSSRVGPAMALLARGRRLRGTWWDPFGRTEVRRAERALAATHCGVVDEVVAGLDGDNHRLAVELVLLADGVRGYEERKLAAIEAYRTELAGRIAAFRAGAVAAAG
jgi:indolepyruvate ferredoxin oxidoreductase